MLISKCYGKKSTGLIFLNKFFRRTRLGMNLIFFFLICICFVCISDEERLYNLTNICSFFLSKQFSPTMSCDVTITAHDFLLRGKEKCNLVTGNIPKLCTVSHGLQLSSPMRIYKTFTESINYVGLRNCFC